MSYWDYAVGTVFFLSIIYGFFRGFISTVFGLVAWAAAVFASLFLSPNLAQALEIDAPNIVLRLATFFAIYLIVRIVGYIVARSMQAVGLGGLDKPLGALFGAARAVFLVGVVVGLLQLTGVSRWVKWEGSATAPLLDYLAKWALEIAPPRPDPSKET